MKIPNRTFRPNSQPHTKAILSYVGGERHPQAEGQRPVPALGFVFKTQWLLYLKKKKVKSQCVELEGI